MPLFEYKAYSNHPEINRQAEVLVKEMLSLRKRQPSKSSKAGNGIKAATTATKTTADPA